ncbi:microtubule-associated protein 9 isoform X2 [Macrotis lagotis]|uniref:microtubule-associated protein 9 isoform X2 n=1 Tax=Macrotis lagotis TaxID=92651 RepID=UPI003D69848D
MSDELGSTILAYTTSPKVAKRTTFQDELQRAVSARTARQQSEDYSDDFDSDDTGSLGDASDISIDDKTINTNLTNNFHVSDDEEKDSPKVTFLKTKTTDGSVTEDLVSFPIKTEKDAEPDTLEEFIISSSKPQGKNPEIEQEEMKTKSTPRLVKFVSSENISNLEKDNTKLPLPRLRGILRKTSHVDDKDVLQEEDNPAYVRAQFSHSAPSSLMRLNTRMVESEQRTLSESPGSEGPTLSTWTPSIIPHQQSDTENLGDHLFPLPSERLSKKDEEQSVDENHNIMNSEDSNNKLSPAEELMVSNTLEKAEENQETTDELEKNMKKLQVFENEDRKSTTSTAFLKEKNEDKNLKKKTSKRIKSFRKKSPLPTASSQYLGTLKFLDQKPSQKQNLELNRADSIRAAVYQDWLVKKNLYVQELQRIKKNEAENLRIKNEQKGAKKEEASASFEAWKAMKEKEAKKIATKKKLEEKKMRKVEAENAEKKGEAQKAFEKWKEKKLEYLKEKNKKEREYESAKKKKEEEYYAEKLRYSLSAVERWHEQKDFLFRQKMKEKVNERRKQEIKRVEKEDKDKLAVNEYERWLGCPYGAITEYPEDELTFQ